MKIGGGKMEILQIPDTVKEMLMYTEGKGIQEKLARLLMSDLQNRLRSCTERLYEFEKKHSLTFKQFKEAWETDKIPDRYSYETEKDYIEWESLNDEHDFLLSQMRELKERLAL